MTSEVPSGGSFLYILKEHDLLNNLIYNFTGVKRKLIAINCISLYTPCGLWPVSHAQGIRERCCLVYEPVNINFSTKRYKYVHIFDICEEIIILSLTLGLLVLPITDKIKIWHNICAKTLNFSAFSLFGEVMWPPRCPLVAVFYIFWKSMICLIIWYIFLLG